VPRNAVPALLPACLADIYLRRLRRAGFDPFDDSLARPLPFKGLRVAAKALFGRY
jgi:phytoene synthase